MNYSDLRDFIANLQEIGELKRATAPVSPHLEMTEVCDRTLRAGGPALLFERPAGHSMPVLGNLFGTPRRVALGMGAQDTGELRRIGQVLATLKAWQDPEFCKNRLGRDKPLGEIDPAKLNVNGSSLTAGHPFAATGGRIVATLAKELAARGPGSRGLISVCAAGGQGVVAILEAA